MNDAHIAYVGLGSNLGDPAHNCQRAIELLHCDYTQVLARSSLYRTEPVGYTDQPRFINAIVKLRTPLPPFQFWAELKAIEHKLGKDIKHRWGPRTIDLDLLLYDNLVINEGGLQIPHPRLHTRSFVMIPLVELAPQLSHPLLGQSMQKLLEQLKQSTRCVKLIP